MASTWYRWCRLNWTAGIQTGPRCARPTPTGSARRGPSSSGCGIRPWTRARGMTPELLHERVDEEWSFIETLRHLVFATDAWVRRAVLGQPRPWDPLDLPHDDMPDEPGVPRDRAARPSLDEMLALRADPMATVRQVLADLIDGKLAGKTEPVTEPGYPKPQSFPVRRCLGAVVNEEWEHRLYAERDLEVLESRWC